MGGCTQTVDIGQGDIRYIPWLAKSSGPLPLALQRGHEVGDLLGESSGQVDVTVAQGEGGGVAHLEREE